MLSAHRSGTDYDQGVEGALDQRKRHECSDLDAGPLGSRDLKFGQHNDAPGIGDIGSFHRIEFDRDVRISSLHGSMLSNARVKDLDDDRVKKDASLAKRKVPFQLKVQELYDKGLRIILAMKPMPSGDRMPSQFSPSGVLRSPEIPEHSDCVLGRQPNFQWDAVENMSEFQAQKGMQVDDGAAGRFGKDSAWMLAQLSSEVRKEVAHMRAAADRIQELAMHLAAARQEGAHWRQQCEALQEERQILQQLEQRRHMTAEAGGAQAQAGSASISTSRMTGQLSTRIGGSAVLERQHPSQEGPMRTHCSAAGQASTTDAYRSSVQGKLQRRQAPVAPVYRGGA